MKFKVNGVKFKFIKLPNGLYMQETPVTQKQWLSVMLNNPSCFKEKKLPVENVSWYDVKEFAFVLGCHCNKEFRLPTEVEWEYACRAGSTTEYNTGYILTKREANFDSDSTTKVKSYPPNAWGLYDMHGNVWEWCEDWYDEDKKYRVLRGGSWSSSAGCCRAAYRSGHEPSDRGDYCGFRLVFVLKKGDGNA